MPIRPTHRGEHGYGVFHKPDPEKAAIMRFFNASSYEVAAAGCFEDEVTGEYTDIPEVATMRNGVVWGNKDAYLSRSTTWSYPQSSVPTRSSTRLANSHWRNYPTEAQLRHICKGSLTDTLLYGTENPTHKEAAFRRLLRCCNNTALCSRPLRIALDLLNDRHQIKLLL